MVRSKKIKRVEEDFQMAPMIDMVFLLIVFFMCISNLADADKGIELKLAESAESIVPEDLANRGKVSLDKDGNLFLSAKPVSLEEMKTSIQKALGENDQLKVQLRIDQDTPFSKIKTTLKACAEAGAHDIIYATVQD